MKILIIAAVFVVLSLCGLSLHSKCHANDEPEINLFIQKGRYSANTVTSLKKKASVSYYDFLSGYYIDRDKQDVINYSFVDQGLRRIYPDKNSSGVLCIDIENKIFQDLRNYDSEHTLFKIANRKLVNLISYIKKNRPNVKIGFYGMPFTRYYGDVNFFNTPDKFQKIFNLVDFISPSLYLYYSNTQFGAEANRTYLERNLQTALKLGALFNKPVIPYVWYRYHPSNKKLGRQIIDRSEMQFYLKVIRDCTFNSQRISGIIWWEPAEKTKHDGKQKGLQDNSIDKILLEYTTPFNNR